MMKGDLLNKVVIGLAGSRAMVRTRAKMCMCVRYLYKVYTSA